MADSLRGVEGSRQNRHRVLVTGLLLGVLLAVAVSLWLRRAATWLAAEERPASTAVAPRARPAGRSPVAELMAAAPADLPALVRGRYRLGPDRRLLLAVAEVQRLRTGAPPAPVTARFQEDRWRILSGETEVGVLSEFPTFEEGTGLLAQWAGRLPQAAAAPSGGGGTSGLERATRDIDAAGLLPRRVARRGEGPCRRVGPGLALNHDLGQARSGRSSPGRVLGLAGARTVAGRRRRNAGRAGARL